VQTYYFDMKDGATVRDRVGMAFPTAAHAIEHSKMIARRFGEEHPDRDPNLLIIVLTENGSEIHREQIYPGVDSPRITSTT
jgi:hypothetical protein